MATQSHDLSPYSSHIVARRLAPIQNADHDAEIDDVLMKALIVIGGVVTHPRTVTGKGKEEGAVVAYDFVAPWETEPGLRSAACHYVEQRPVTWLSKGTMDTLNHLLVVTITTDGLMLLTATDAEHRAALLFYLQLDFFDGWETVSQAILVKAIVESRALKTLWLAGIHRDTTVKPSSKILSGSSLAEAIDPMNDSSYLAGAVRSTAGGVSLRNSSVWTGPNDDLQAFEDRTVTLLKEVRAAFNASPPANLQVHSSLARWVTSMNGTSGCYFIAHVDPEIIDNDSGKKKAQDLVDAFTVELDKPGSPAGLPTWAFTAEVTDVASGATAKIDIVPDLYGNGDRVEYVISPLPPAPFDEWATAVIASPAILRVYYDSGHTIAGGALSMVRLQDLPFDKFRYGDFSSYNVKQEKPKKSRGVQVPIKNMTTQGDKSLFKWIFKEGLSFLGLSAPSPNKCWLYCDDGSSEVADFVHLDIGASPKRLTLFHAKGASSKKASRRAVSGPYEVVAAQAIKNLRAFDAQQLLGRIKKRLNENGDERIWENAWSVGLAPMAKADAFAAALDTLGTNYDCEVIIVQPHVLQSDYMKGNKPSTTVGAGQLRTLLFGVESLARAVNAKVRVVVDKA